MMQINYSKTVALLLVLSLLSSAFLVSSVSAEQSGVGEWLSKTSKFFFSKGGGGAIAVTGLQTAEVSASDSVDLDCADSDGGLNYNVQGKTTGNYGRGNVFSYDYCFEGTDNAGNKVNLIEFYCIDKINYGPKSYFCPNGCSDGACITTVSNVVCKAATVTASLSKESFNHGEWVKVTVKTLDDAGKPVASTVRSDVQKMVDGTWNAIGGGGVKTSADGVWSQDQLFNYEPGSYRLHYYAAADDNTFCSGGGEAYVKFTVTAQVTTACSDSDGGLNYDVKGTASASATSKTDNCWEDGITLSEYYCESSTAASPQQINYVCANGCRDGACLQQSPKAIVDENVVITRNDYFVVKSLSGDFTLRYLSAFSSQETTPGIKLMDPRGNIFYLDYKPQPGRPGEGVEDATLNYGGSVFRVWNASTDISSNFNIRIDLNGDGKLGGSVAQACTDSDGYLNYYVKGTTSQSGTSNGGTDQCEIHQGNSISVVSDCSGSNCYLLENYCYMTTNPYTGSSPSSQAYQCPNGCSDGACVAKNVADNVEVIGTSIRDALKVQQSRTYDLREAKGAKARIFTVNVDFVGSGGGVFTINGESTGLVTPTYDKFISDGSLVRAYGAQYPSVDFSITPTSPRFGFTGVNWVCSDASSRGDTGSSRGCESSEYWRRVADEGCEGICSKNTGKCGVVGLKLSADCSMSVPTQAEVCPARIDLSFDRPAYVVGERVHLKLATYDKKNNLVGADLNVMISFNGKFITEDMTTTKPSGIREDSEDAALPPGVPSGTTGTYAYTIASKPSCANMVKVTEFFNVVVVTGIGGACGNKICEPGEADNCPGDCKAPAATVTTVTDTLNEGETKTYRLSGKNYKVMADFVGSTSARFTINGQITASLAANQAEILADGGQIIVNKIIVNELIVNKIASENFAGGSRQVDFTLSAPAALPATAEYTVELAKGWNMIGLFPIMVVGGGQGSTTCSYLQGGANSGSSAEAYLKKNMFSYDPLMKKFVSLGELDQLKDIRAGDYMVNSLYNGFWLRSSETCSITMQIDSSVKEFYDIINKISSEQYRLAKGWNFFAVWPEMDGKSVDDIKGGCDVSRAFHYSPFSRSWEKVTDFDHAVGYGFVLKVADDCVLGYENSGGVPPPLPDENENIAVRST